MLYLDFMASVLEIIPLGGIGEFGMNCMAVRYGDEMLILDAGMGFPEETAYGVDVSFPNFNFLEEYRDDITAIVLTHGHEDHLGALPYLLKKFNVPVYCSHFTAGLAESKLEEHDLLGDSASSRGAARRRGYRRLHGRVHKSFALARRLFLARRSRPLSVRSFTPAITRLTKHQSSASRSICARFAATARKACSPCFPIQQTRLFPVAHPPNRR